MFFIVFISRYTSLILQKSSRQWHLLHGSNAFYSNPEWRPSSLTGGVGQCVGVNTLHRLNLISSLYLWTTHVCVVYVPNTWGKICSNDYICGEYRKNTILDPAYQLLRCVLTVKGLTVQGIKLVILTAKSKSYFGLSKNTGNPIRKLGYGFGKRR